MTTATQRTAPTTIKAQRAAPPKVAPSRLDPSSSPSFSLEQELEPFGAWTSEPIWVPPKDSSTEFAKSMLERHGLLSSKCSCWSDIVEEHRASFQQVREIDLCKASIRLPKGKLFVSVTEREHFDEITDTIPSCVQTRLDEFLDGPGKQRGVKVYYLKPLCVEVGDELIFTTQEKVNEAIELVQNEVFSAYRRLYLSHRPMRSLINAIDFGLSLPRRIVVDYQKRKQKALDDYHARLEFKRRKTALRARNAHRRLRTDGCSFDEMLALTNPLDRDDVMEQFGIEHQLTQAQRDRLTWAAAQSIPWFVALSMGISYGASFASSIAIMSGPPLMVCDPAFVAEMPGSGGVVLKIGHFDEVRGVTHVEI